MDPHDNQYQLLWMALNHRLCQMTFRHLTPWILAHLLALVKDFSQGIGDPYRIRTDVKGVRGLCLNRLTNGPYKSRRLPIFTSRFQLTIFGTSKLNFCVRNGNRWNLTVIDTDRFD